MEMIDLVKPLLEMLAGKYGWLVQLLTFIGTARLVLKPVMSALEGVVAATPSKSDDSWLASVKEGKVYKTVAYVLDWFASIKLPK